MTVPPTATGGPPTTSVRRVALLGSTGSIGTQTVDVVTAAGGRFAVQAVSAGGANPELLARQAAQLRVSVVGVARPEAADAVRTQLDAHWPADLARPELHIGPDASTEIAAQHADVVLNAIDGAQGLRATIAALDAGNTVALANKESLIAGGSLVTERARPGQLVPVDSEHSALAQCLMAGRADEVRRLVLTASGGPFRGRTRAELGDVTPADALAHPTWDMGPLVTTNSATLVNKGLEMIEAHLLFGVPYERISVVVHPESVVHSMVEFVDGSTMAQASPPDMRLPISLALDWPNRVIDAAHAVDWTTAQTWHFEPLENAAFPAVELARRAGSAGGCAPAVFNAANEELVAAFHAGEIAFLNIVDSVADVLGEWLTEHHSNQARPGTVLDIEDAQTWARHKARAAAARR